ncbi:IDEAL domain-containing protein [Paenibacillus sp. WLX1005]|uniref:IDEAL domain-containing protein n=1 Tax=unclassified Paenibacillus TaxID=185978 RepID=UPI0039840196
MYKMKVTYEVMLGLAAEMVWDQVLREHRVEELNELIDRALADRDEQAFQQWTNELRSLTPAIQVEFPEEEHDERKTLSH